MRNVIRGSDMDSRQPQGTWSLLGSFVQLRRVKRIQMRTAERVSDLHPCLRPCSAACGRSSAPVRTEISQRPLRGWRRHSWFPAEASHRPSFTSVKYLTRHLRVCREIRCLHRMNPQDFPLAPPAGQRFDLSCKIPQRLPGGLMDNPVRAGSRGSQRIALGGRLVFVSSGTGILFVEYGIRGMGLPCDFGQTCSIPFLTPWSRWPH